MKLFNKKSRHLLFIITIVLVLPYVAMAQLSLVSSSPTHGATNVATTVDLQFTFSAALDTNAVFEMGNNDGGNNYENGHEDDKFFIGIEIFPEDSIGEPDNVVVSEDLTTVTIQGILLTPDTRFMFFLTGAKAVNGDSLDKPYVVVFSTGSALPTGAVTGDVTFPDGDPAGAVVALMGMDFKGDNLSGLAVVNSPYEIQYVEDGAYYPISVKDTNGDNELDLIDGDAFGIYDPNNDGVVDSVVVAGDTLEAINIDLQFPDKQTARVPYPNTETAAAAWASDAALISVHSENIDPEGESYAWHFMYYSSTLDDFLNFMAVGDGLIPMKPNFEDKHDENNNGEGEEGPHFPPKNPLPEAWIDSDSVAFIAETNGGSDFRANNLEVEIYADLGTFVEHDSIPPDSGGGVKSFDELFEARKNAYFAELAKSIELEEPIAVWFFFYRTDKFGDFFEIGIDAVTGEVLHTAQPNTAHERLPLANDKATEWASDAELIFVGTHHIGPEGRAVEWQFEYYSANNNARLFVGTHGAEVHAKDEPEPGRPYNSELPEGWIDSDAASDVAEANSENFRDEFREHWVRAWLQTNPVNNQTSWWFEYNANHNGHGENNRRTVAIDALTGDLLEAFGPLTLESSSPADGEVNVQTTTDFTFTFSAPIDTFHKFIDEHFIEFELFPIKAAGRPTGIETSEDLKTVTLEGLTLGENTRYFGLLSGAESVHRQFLEHPYVINFTTGDTLPPASISGDVSAEEEWRHTPGTFVMLFNDGLFPGNLVGLGIANSPYEIKNVADGKYLPVAFNPNDWRGPLIGYPDPDKDGVPDSVTIANGTSIEDIDIVLREPPKQTAQVQFDLVEQTAQNWAADARFVGVGSGFVGPDGDAFEWVYLFYSESLDDFTAYGAFANIILYADPKMDFPDTTAIPENWIDSDAAAQVAEDNGGSELRDINPDTYVFSFLEAREWHTDSGTVEIDFESSPVPIIKNKKWHISNEIEKALEDNVVAVWIFSYHTPNSRESTEFVIDAISGELLFVKSPFSAHEGRDRANDEATQFFSDAKLVNVGTLSIGRGGRAHEWRYTYHSATLDSFFAIVVFPGMGAHIEPLHFDMIPPSKEPLPEQWKDSYDVMAVAEHESDNFMNRHHDAFVDAFLSRGLLADDTLAVWMVRYISFADMDSIVVLINAETAELITNVKQNTAGNLPKIFALQQNYPNPFNPQTTIEYQLPKAGFVELHIFNMLGQRVRTLIEKDQSPGYYKIIWDGKNDIGIPSTSGIYIFRLHTKEFTRTKKMIFLK